MAGKITSGTVMPLKKMASTNAIWVGPVASSSQNAVQATRNRTPKLTSGEHDAEREAEPGGDVVGPVQVEQPRSHERQGQAAGGQVVRRPAEVGGEVPAQQADRAVQVDGHVAAADPFGEVCGGPPPQIITVMIMA